MNSFLMLISVGPVIVTYITSIISACVWAQLKVNIHSVIIKLPIIVESFATIFTLNLLVSVICVHQQNVIL